MTVLRLLSEKMLHKKYPFSVYPKEQLMATILAIQEDTTPYPVTIFPPFYIFSVLWSGRVLDVFYDSENERICHTVLVTVDDYIKDHGYIGIYENYLKEELGKFTKYFSIPPEQLVIHSTF